MFGFNFKRTGQNIEQNVKYVVMICVKYGDRIEQGDKN